MNDVFLPFTYKTAQILPCATETALSKKRKESDFLISDAKCVHRMIDIKYDREVMDFPKITFVAMRHNQCWCKYLYKKIGIEKQFLI